METMVSNVVYLTTAEFKNLVFNYDVNKEWKYAGKLPAIIDFYADWCGPCKMVAPILQEIAKDYDGKLIIYKVDTENERELAAAFGISSIPTLLFVPMTGQPQAAMGALPRQAFDKAIKDVLLTD
jgi:thioredoxin 1